MMFSRAARRNKCYLAVLTKGWKTWGGIFMTNKRSVWSLFYSMCSHTLCIWLKREVLVRRQPHWSLFCSGAMGRFCGNWRIMEWLRVEVTSGGHLFQPHCSIRATYSWLSRTMFRRLVNISKGLVDLGPIEQKVPMKSIVLTLRYLWTGRNLG